MLLSSVQGLGSYNAHPHLCTPVAVTLGSAVRTDYYNLIYKYRRCSKFVSSNKEIFSQSDAQLEIRIRKIALYDGLLESVKIARSRKKQWLLILRSRTLATA